MHAHKHRAVLSGARTLWPGLPALVSLKLCEAGRMWKSWDVTRYLNTDAQLWVYLYPYYCSSVSWSPVLKFWSLLTAPFFLIKRLSPKEKKKYFLSFCLQKPFLSPPFSCPFFLCCLCLLVILALLIKNLILLVASQRSLLSPTEGWAQDLNWYSVYVLPEACIFKTWTSLKLPCVRPASSMNW